jgi:hypothetical protein
MRGCRHEPATRRDDETGGYVIAGRAEPIWTRARSGRRVAGSHLPAAIVAYEGPSSKADGAVGDKWRAVFAMHPMRPVESARVRHSLQIKSCLPEFPGSERLFPDYAAKIPRFRSDRDYPSPLIAGTFLLQVRRLAAETSR